MRCNHESATIRVYENIFKLSIGKKYDCFVILFYFHFFWSVIFSNFWMELKRRSLSITQSK